MFPRFLKIESEQEMIWLSTLLEEAICRLSDKADDTYSYVYQTECRLLAKKARIFEARLDELEDPIGPLVTIGPAN